jgi:HEPN domain-containing protein
LTKQEHITYWLEQAEDSWQSALVLMEGKKYAMAAFCFHLSIEKLPKGIWVKNNQDNYPPKIHNLIYLHDAAKLDLEEVYTDMFKPINTWNMEGRYPEYLNKLHYAINKEYLTEKLSSLETLKQCLQKILQ